MDIRTCSIVLMPAVFYIIGYMKRFIRTLMILLFFSLPCMAAELGVLPEAPEGGQAVYVRIDKPGMFKYTVYFNGAEYTPYETADKSLEIILPLEIEEQDTKLLSVKGRLWGVSLKKFDEYITVLPRDIEVYKLKTGDVKMRDRQPSVQEQRDAVVNAFNTLTSERLWEGGFIMPVMAKISSPFALKRESKTYSYFHKGVDLATKKGTPVKAANSGRVILRGDRFNVYGNCLVIDHGQGVVTCYMHLDEALKEEGSPVQKGDEIGKLGSTGWSSGPHLHFGVYIHGSAVDPVWWINFSGHLFSEKPAEDINP